MRVSLAGDGTDLEAYYARYGGAVVNATIDKHSYAFMSETPGDCFELSSAGYPPSDRHFRQEPSPWDEHMRLPMAVLERFGIRDGLSVFLASEVPLATGLGFASALTVALIKSLAILSGARLSRRKLAELACAIEIEDLRMPIGKQDPYAVAYGGLNYIEFRSDGVTVEPLQLPSDSLAQLQQRLMLFFTGRRGNSTAILREQKRNCERNRASTIAALHGLKDAADALRADLLNGNIAAVGEWLDRTWAYKRQLGRGVSDPWIDEWYRRARAAGALGGKLSGAGGGGFLLLYCEPAEQERLTRTLAASGLTRMGFRFEPGGATVILNKPLSQDSSHDYRVTADRKRLGLKVQGGGGGGGGRTDDRGNDDWVGRVL